MSRPTQGEPMNEAPSYRPDGGHKVGLGLTSGGYCKESGFEAALGLISGAQDLHEASHLGSQTSRGMGVGCRCRVCLIHIQTCIHTNIIFMGFIMPRLCSEYGTIVLIAIEDPTVDAALSRYEVYDLCVKFVHGSDVKCRTLSMAVLLAFIRGLAHDFGAEHV